MFAEVDYTQIAVAAIGLIGTCVSGYLVYRTRRLELRAAEHAKAAKQSEQKAEALSGVLKKGTRRRRKPPPHPDG